MDFRDFAAPPGERPPLASFVDPGMHPPRFIFAPGEYGPPYEIERAVVDPYPGCDSTFALVCGVQHSIRLVTKVRRASCDALAAGGVRRQAALDAVTGRDIVEEGTTGFAAFVMLANGTIVADGLKPELIGQRFDGVSNAGFVPQPALLDYIAWVADWEGGFVPHFTTRLAPSGDPVRAVAYIEPCPSGERIGVAFGRQPRPAEESCDAGSNSQCAIDIVKRVTGMGATDFLASATAAEMHEQFYEVTYTAKYTVGTFYSFMYLISWWGALGPDPWVNPTPFANNGGTNLAIGGGLDTAIVGRNLTFIVEPRMFGYHMGDWLLAVGNKAAYMGGAWLDYPWSTEALGDHLKISNTIGIVWNNTPVMVGVGLVHAPGKRVRAPMCETCSSNVSTLCAAINSVRLASHAQTELLTPLGTYSKISKSKWFGSLHTDATFEEYAGTWPEGFYVTVFDYNGTCVVDGREPSNIGASVVDVFGNDGDATHERLKRAADLGGGWVPITTFGIKKILRIIKVNKQGLFSYIAVGFVHARASWRQDCTSKYSEPCSESNAEALVGAVNADIIACESVAEFVAVLRDIRDRSGSYASDSSGDFSAQIYNLDSGCLDVMQTANISCPSALTDEEKILLEPALKSLEGQWISFPASGKGAARNAYVYRSAFAPPGVPEKREVLIISFIKAAFAPARCGGPSGACVADAMCTPEGRCMCQPGFRTDFFPDNSTCSVVPPAAMQCADIRGLDCTDPGARGARTPSRPALWTCPSCAAGFFCPEGEPLPCPAGQFCPARSLQPVLCPTGTASRATRATSNASCIACPIGSFAASGGQMECDACQAGKYANGMGKTACDLCDLAYYQPETSSTSCVSCQEYITGSVTPFLAAADQRQCLCPEGSFLPAGAQACETCPEGMTCEQGSDMRHMGESTGPAPRLQEQYWSHVEDPLSVFMCKTGDHCPGGVPGTCGPDLENQACAHCKSGYFWTSEGCRACTMSDSSAAFFPFVPCVLGFLVPVILYASNSGDFLTWAAPGAVFSAIVFVLLNHYQIIDIIASINVKVPSSLQTTYTHWQVTNNLLSVFKTNCTGVTSIQAMMIIKAVSPVVLALMCLVDFGVSRLVVRLGIAKSWVAMNADRLFNVYASVLYTFFGAIAAMSLELFKCRRNPNGHDTMTMDVSVICYTSDTWKSMLAIGIICCLIYVLGTGFVLVRATFVAAKHFQDASFQQRWKFLFIKYRLGAWWWGVVFLLKNFLINLTLVVSSSLFQCYAIMFVIIAYAILVAFVWPYRSRWANRAEMLSSVSIIFNAACVAAFGLAQQPDGADDSTLSTFASFITYTPMACCAPVVLYYLVHAILEGLGTAAASKKEQARQDRATETARRIRDSYSKLLELPPGTAAEFYAMQDSYNKWCFQKADDILRAELLPDVCTSLRGQVSTKAYVPDSTKEGDIVYDV